VIATAVASLTRTQESNSSFSKYGVLLAGLLLVWYVGRSEFIDRRLSIVIQWALKRFTTLEVADYVALLHLGDGYGISELQVEAGDWIAGRTLSELALPNEGVLVLGVHRAEKPFIGSPTGALQLREKDVLLLYGPIDRIGELDQRRDDMTGDAAHNQACEEQEDLNPHFPFDFPHFGTRFAPSP
jgi:Trk K+ transport system NAD-binding subunit